MILKNAVVLVTGSNRGIGLAFAKEALARGARKVYAAARDASAVTIDGVEPIELDVSKPDQVMAAARRCADVTVVIKNAGVAEVGGGAIVNVLSVASWRNTPVLSTYGATKSAAWALTNGIRNDLRDQETQVLAVHVGPVDTDLTRSFDIPKSSPELVVEKTFDALEAGDGEVLVDESAARIKQGLTATPPLYLHP